MRPAFPDYLSVSYDYGSSEVACLYFSRPSNVIEHPTSRVSGGEFKTKQKKPNPNPNP